MEGREETMKRLWRRVLVLSAMLLLAMSVRALAAQTQYSAKTIKFPNQYGGGWSNQFTVYSSTNIAVGINITNAYAGAYEINTRLTYILENVNTHVQYKLFAPSNYNYNYELQQTVPAGTYSFGVYCSGSYSFNLYFRVTGSAGINVPDELEVMVGTTEGIDVTEQNPYGTYYINVKSCISSNKTVATVSKDSTYPYRVNVYGKNQGYATITVYGVDGSTDVMSVHVVSTKTAPTLLDKTLHMGVGDIVENEVLGATAAVTWSSSNTKVARVNADGQIRAVGVGTATIHAVTRKNSIKYDLACQVTVGQSDPEFIIRITNYLPKKKRVKIRITNQSGAPMTVYSKGAMLTTWPEYTQLRTMKMKSGSKVVIKNNQSKKITFNIKGTRLDATYNKLNLGARVRFTLDGLTYFARCTTDEHLGEYILKANLANNANWLFSYSQYGV